MRLTHIGHACVLVELAGVRLLIDPGTYAQGWERLSALDAVLLTHAHPDHVDRDRLPELLEGNPEAAVLAEPTLAEQLTGQGTHAQPLEPGGTVELGAARLTGYGGQHAVIHPDIERIGNVGVLLAADGEPTFFHPGDSYETAPAGVDVLAVPLVAPWGALKEAVELVRAVAPKVAFPVHDAILSQPGRQLYLNLLQQLTATDWRDLYDAGDVAIEL